MNETRTFFKFVVPSVLAFALSGVYTIVDGFFVGQSIGDMGIASITLGYPVAAFIQAAGTGIGLAGAIRFTILRGQNQRSKEKECFTVTALLLFLASILIMALTFLFLKPLLGFLGAEGETYELTAQYVRIIALGTLFQTFSTGLVPFIRNLGGAAFAMAAMIAGFLTNIALDYAFVWKFSWGMGGAAWATVIGQAVTLGASVVFLIKKQITLVPVAMSTLPAYFRQLFKIALAPFGLTFSPQITTILMNRFLLIYGGEQAVAVYGCIAYITAVVYLLLQGVGDGSQPLISRFYSEGKPSAMLHTRRLAYITAGGISALCMLLLFLTRNFMGQLFGASPDASLRVAAYLPLFLAVLPLLSYIRVTTAYFYATEKSLFSYMLVYGEPVFLAVLLVVTTSVLFLGLSGVWLCVPLAQTLVFLVSLLTRRLSFRHTGA